LWLGILSLAVTMHADVFEQKGTPNEFYRVAWRRVFGNQKMVIDMGERLKVNQKLVQEFSSGKDLYIFVLDDSESLNEEIHSEELNCYLKKIEKDGREVASEVEKILPSEDDRQHTLLNIGKSELVRSIHRIKNGDLVHFWKFGNETKMVELKPGELETPMKWYYEIGDYSGPGKTTKPNLIKKIKEVKHVEGGDTNFEKFLQHAEQLLSKESDISRIHFVLASDFMHDIHKKKDGEGKRKCSKKCRASLEGIKHRVNKLSKSKKIQFHLFCLKQSQLEDGHSVLSYFEKNIDWRQIRTLDALGFRDNPKFLSNMISLGQPLVFEYSPGRFDGKRIKINFPENLTRSLAYISLENLNGRQSKNLNFEVFTSENEASTKIGNGNYAEIPKTISSFWIKPNFIADSIGANNYRLLFSFRNVILESEGDNGASSGKVADQSGNIELNNVTFAMKVQFHKNLSKSGAVSILFSLSLFCFCLSCFSISVILKIRKQNIEKRRVNPSEISEEQVSFEKLS